MAEGPSLEGAEVTLWCCGLPMIGRRALEASERNTLRKEATRKRLYCLLWIATPILFIAMLMGLMSLDKGNGSDANPLFMPIFLVSLIVLAVVSLTTVQEGKRGLALFRDLKQDVVLRFSGVLPSADKQDLVQSSLLSERGGKTLLRIDPMAPQTIEVLPLARRILLVNGEVPPVWTQAVIGETASVPQTTASIDATGGTTSSVPDGFFKKGERPLSKGENREIEKTVRRLWLRPLPLTLLLTVWFWPLLIYFIATRTMPNTRAFFGLGAFAITMAWIYVLSVRHALKLAADRRNAYVILISLPQVEIDALGSLDQEMLPISGLLWSEHGRPAAWRRLRHLQTLPERAGLRPEAPAKTGWR